MPNVCNRIKNESKKSEEVKSVTSTTTTFSKKHSSKKLVPTSSPLVPTSSLINIAKFSQLFSSNHNHPSTKNTTTTTATILNSPNNSPVSIEEEIGEESQEPVMMMDNKSSRSSSVSSIEDIGDDNADTPANVQVDTQSNENTKNSSKKDSQQQKQSTETDTESDNMNCDSKNNDTNLANHIKRLESIIQSLKDSTTAQISQLRDLVTQKDKTIYDLTEKLEQQRDYDEIKRELSIVRTELSHSYGPAAVVQTALTEGPVNHSTSASVANSSSSPSAASGQQSSLNEHQRNALFNPLMPFPQLQSLGNVESFGTLLGEEIANTYAKAMVAAAANASQNSSSSNNISSTNKANSNSNQNNGNNRTDSLSPSQLSNGDEMTAMEEKCSTESASTTPTSAMICPDGAEPLTHSPLGATTVSDLGLQMNSSYSPASPNLFYDKLQHQLRSNVERYMNQTLNTSHISRYVRELLSAHNIGQRLFAKYVLGLSQGTVSELLSKPKPWDKLTEKGRDSYRKMHAWSTDKSCINLLKMMVPRKEYGSYIGKETSTFKQDDSEERIVQILNEAQRSMKGINRPDAFIAHPFLNGDAIANKTSDPLSSLKMNNDAASDNGSDRDENKSETASISESRKSPPTLNATAMATINNFYRNMQNDADSPRNNSNSAGRSSNRSKLLSPSNDNQSSPAAGDSEANQAQELIRFYHDHLTKMIGQQIEDFRNSQNYDDIRNVIALQQELARINPFLQAHPDLFAGLFSSGMFNGANYLNGLPLGLDSLSQTQQQQNNPLDSIRKNSQLDSPSLRDQRDSSLNEPRIKIDNILSQLKSESSGSPSQNGGSSGGQCLNSSGSVFNNGDTPDDLAASPLQRMQSITNSLLSQSSLPTLPSQPPRPAKAVLPPITQQQFDQYNNLNTEDIVKRVKEQLSQYSISQRLFGESVLGLSQGSVSDLLARPKPWHMLTQKGREPFIRMKMFLEDDNAIHKLVASQYKIAPEKLMRTGNFVSGPGILPGLAHSINATSLPPSAPLSSSPNPLQSLNTHLNTPPSNKSNTTTSVTKSSNAPTAASVAAEMVLKYEQSMSPSSVDNSARSNTSSPELSGSSNAAGTGSAPSPLPIRSRLSAGAYSNNMNQNNLLRPSLTNQSSNSFNPIQPSVYELAALTSDLDTQIITTRIKETLMTNNIGQKIFGEVVLGLSQGSVSELLSKPKPWHMLSIKGREPFIRMQLWLNDANNIDKLQTLKNERREANKRRRTHLDESISSFKPFDNQLFNFSNNFAGLNPLTKGLTAGSTGSPFPLQSMNPQPAKKARILFTEEQKEALRIAFAMDPYPSSATAEFLAKELNLSIRTITNWFHNHRMRLKQINSSASNNEESSNPATTYNLGRDSVLFDQSKFRTLLTQRLADLKLRSNNLSNSNNNSNHGSSNNNDNSNQFGSFNQNSPPQMHRMKYSPSMFQSQSVYSNNTNSCSSPGSSASFHEEEDMGTLDLSMSSHNNQQFNNRHHHHNHHSPDKLDSTGRSSMHDDSDDECRTGEDDEGAASADEEQQTKQQSSTRNNNTNNKQFRSGSSRRKPQNVMSSSSRRKAAQPQQWVAPATPVETEHQPSTNFGDDDYIEDDEDFEEESDVRLKNEINGLYKQLDKNNGQDDDEDQKTDDEDIEEELMDDDDMNSSGDLNGSPSYNNKKQHLKTTSTKIKDDNNSSTTGANILQECVQ